jgi:hypothetical protein
MMVILLLTVALIASLGLNAFTAWLSYKEKRELHIRLASKSVAESEYYLQQLPKAVKRQDEKISQQIKQEKKMTKEDREIKEVATRF